MSQTQRQTTPPLSTTLTRQLPDMLIIGAAKAGTSALTDYLQHHPQLFMSPAKEPEFFSHDERFHNQKDWYHRLFSDAQPGQWRVEASTAYTRWPEHPNAAPRLADAIPEARFIYLMRHPVERTYSHFVHRVTKELYPRQPIPVDFEQHIRNDPMCINSSRYMDQIGQYLTYYGRDRFLFLLTEDLLNNTAQTLSRICAFLEIEDRADALIDANTRVRSGERVVQHRVREQITQPLKTIPGARQLARLVPQGGRDAAYRLLKRTRHAAEIERQFTPSPMKPETRQELLAYFRKPNRELADFLGRGLSHWDR